MKKLLLTIFFLAACSSPQPTPTPIVSGGISCVQPNDPDSHVYNSSRLQVLNPCVSVTGTIDFIRNEADGDYHIGLKVDPQYSNLPNSCNTTSSNTPNHTD